MKKVYFDTETTGFAPGNIGQLAVIIEYDDCSIEAKNYFFDLEYISEDAARVCGRDLNFYKEVSKGLKFEHYSSEILKIFTDAIWIAHNENFDENFLCTEFWRLGTLIKPTDKLCTMEYFKPILKLPGKGRYKYKNPKLSELVDSFSIDNDKVRTYSYKLFGSSDKEYDFHDARYDITATFVVCQIHREQVNNVPNKTWTDTFTIR